MDKIKVLLSDSDMITCLTLKEKILVDNNIEVIGVSIDGIDTFNIINKNHPDVVIMDMVLPSLDGIGILEHFHSNGNDYKPIFIITSPIKNESIIQYIIGLGASYYIAKPYDLDSISNRIKMVYGFRYDENVLIDDIEMDESTPLDRRIHNLIYSLGIYPGVKGYEYIKEALLMSVNDTTVLSKIMDKVYIPISIKYNVTPRSIERAIRHAITRSCNLENEYIYEMFGCMINSKKQKPTNKEFLSSLTDKLLFEIGDTK